MIELLISLQTFCHFPRKKGRLRKDGMKLMHISAKYITYMREGSPVTYTYILGPHAAFLDVSVGFICGA